MAGAGEFGHGNRREGGGEFRVISLAHGGLAVPTSSSTGCRTRRARLVRSAAASAWASRGRVAAAMGQHIAPARCIAQRFHLAGGQADDFGEEGKDCAADLAVGHHGADAFGPVVLRCLRSGRLVEHDAPEWGAASSCAQHAGGADAVAGHVHWAALFAGQGGCNGCDISVFAAQLVGAGVRWSRGRAGPSPSRAGGRSAVPTHAASC
jgi:hypothetical protein